MEDILQDMEQCIGYHKTKNIVIAGDFNAKSSVWGDRLTDARGQLLEDWMIVANLYIINRGNIPTCVRSQGTSVIDITLTNERAMSHVKSWKVAENIITLSDHNMILFELKMDG